MSGKLAAVAGVALVAVVGLGVAAWAVTQGADQGEAREVAAVYVVETVKDGQVSVHRVDPVSGRVGGD